VSPSPGARRSREQSLDWMLHRLQWLQTNQDASSINKRLPSPGCRPRVPGPEDSLGSGVEGNVVEGLLKAATCSCEVDPTFGLTRSDNSSNHTWFDPMLQESYIKTTGNSLQSDTTDSLANFQPEAPTGGDTAHITDQ
jgi:hypothetical protein